MTTDNQPQVPISPPAADAWLTGGTLTLIAIGVLLALALIWVGARLKRERKAAEREVLERQGDRRDGPAATPPADVIAPPLPEMPATPLMPPVAPVPPPLDAGGTPVPVTAPLDASVAKDGPTPPSTGDDDADDLVQLKGVGPKLAARLRELGVTRFAQIAALSPNEAQALDAQLGNFQGRLMRDRWVDQARYLANGDRTGFEAEFGKL